MVAHFLIAFAAAALAVGLALLLMRQLERRFGGAGPARGLERGIEPIVFLFRNQVLIDATGPARALLATLPGQGDWQGLASWLAMRLPDFGALLPDLSGAARLEFKERAEGHPLRLLAEDLGEGVIRLTLADPAAENAGILVDSLSLGVMEQELEILRSTMDHSPMLAWRQDRQGQVTWANSAYMDLADARLPDQTQWPLPQIVDLSARPASGGGARRIQVDHDGQSRWYDCHVHEVAEQTVAIALPADAAVRAERALREFVQTLTKTFADLPIGLAIFDRDRNLQLFNPALIDLTGLATGFLTARPTLYAFLDRLREARMVPEPKDYRSWRNQMASLEAAASSGHHVEMWSLPGGQTYRVTGRPHPDGAVAFLFEDITSEISLTRKFRADLSLGAEVLDLARGRGGGLCREWRAADLEPPLWRALGCRRAGDAGRPYRDLDPGLRAKPRPCRAARGAACRAARPAGARRDGRPGRRPAILGPARPVGRAAASELCRADADAAACGRAAGQDRAGGSGRDGAAAPQHEWMKSPLPPDPPCASLRRIAGGWA
ncbi:MAG: PAS-domain containing protein [Paracoccus aminovorans]|nr:PAS-domain containing protein [Paracoccus aminovorans]